MLLTGQINIIFTSVKQENLEFHKSYTLSQIIKQPHLNKFKENTNCLKYFK